MMIFKDKKLLTTLFEQAKSVGVNYVKFLENGIKGKDKTAKACLETLCNLYNCETVLNYLITKQFITYAKAKEFEPLMHQYLDIEDTHAKASK